MAYPYGHELISIKLQVIQGRLTRSDSGYIEITSVIYSKKSQYLFRTNSTVAPVVLRPHTKRASRSTVIAHSNDSSAAGGGGGKSKLHCSGRSLRLTEC